MRLTAKFVREVEPPERSVARYSDGQGLMLVVQASGSKSYIQRLSIHGKRHDIGLGSVRWISLTEARKVATDNWKLARMGGDPLAAKRTAPPTFAEAVETVIALHSATWRDGAKSADQWRASLAAYAMPRLGGMTLDRITTADVLACLIPIWNDKRETARRVRQRIGAVMKWAIAEGHRTDNPAGDAITAALPRNGIKQALPYEDVADALETLRKSAAYPTTTLAIKFLVLTASRSGEVRGATWAEIDFESATWTVPADRMKAGAEHRVPLSDAALSVLERARELADTSGLIFPSMRGRVMSDSTLSKGCTFPME